MSPKQVDKIGNRIREILQDEVGTANDPDTEMKRLTIDLVVGVAHNLAVIAAK